MEIQSVRHISTNISKMAIIFFRNMPNIASKPVITVSNDLVEIVFSSFKPYDDQWVNTDTRKWISLADRSLRAMVEICIDAIRDNKTPKNIIIQCMQKFIGGCNFELVRGYMNEIVEEANAQKYNKVIFATCHFVPSHETVWGIVSLFNIEAHRSNERMGMARFNLHRYVMSQISDTDKSLRIRPAMYAEHQLGLALGNHLSYEAITNIIGGMKTVFQKSFNNYNWGDNTISADTRVVKPPSLAHCPGYVDNTFMRQLMVQKHIMRPDRSSKRQRRLCMSDQRSPGWRHYHLYKQHGPLRRFNEREGALEAHIMMLKRADEVPDWTVQQQVQEVDSQLEDEDEWTDDENLQIHISNDGAYEIINKQVERMDIHDEQVQTDDLEDVEIQEVEVQEEPVETEQKGEKQKNCNEEDNKKLNDVLRRLQEAERQLQVLEEKSKAYQKENENKEASIVKEKAASRYWKQQSDANKENLNHVNKELSRMEDQYNFVRDLYETSKPKKVVRIVTTKDDKAEDEMDSDVEIE